ncbi:hypothetical protein TrST_g13665 [Triparma strigata]|uniref:DUF2237 domain-containing protein n=1 Tax=Triparma strigata TaxID=1606541 RepID=A0A9W7EQ10_9STRA|nr:hypothetical protein TrST_g13665 [Triparma strigata]
MYHPSSVILFLLILLLSNLPPSSSFFTHTPSLPLPPTHLSSTSPISGIGISPPLNVLGSDLQCCCSNVGNSGIGTGFYRDGHCSTGPQDSGRHTVCIIATLDFLVFSKSVGNDLSTPVAEYSFPGVRPGDRWCLCASRWVQAYQSNCAPKVCLLATHEKTLNVVTEETRGLLLKALKEYAVDGDEAEEIEKRLDEKRRNLDKLIGEVDVD